jgi:hypothetical protein
MVQGRMRMRERERERGVYLPTPDDGGKSGLNRSSVQGGQMMESKEDSVSTVRDIGGRMGSVCVCERE